MMHSLDVIMLAEPNVKRYHQTYNYWKTFVTLYVSQDVQTYQEKN